jgi:hypothetical protein
LFSKKIHCGDHEDIAGLRLSREVYTPFGSTKEIFIEVWKETGMTQNGIDQAIALGLSAKKLWRVFSAAEKRHPFNKTALRCGIRFSVAYPERMNT